MYSSECSGKHFLFVLFELHCAFYNRVDGVIFADTSTNTWSELATALTNDNVAWDDFSSTVYFYAESFCVRITTQLSGATRLSMRHKLRIFCNNGTKTLYHAASRWSSYAYYGIVNVMETAEETEKKQLKHIEKSTFVLFFGALVVHALVWAMLFWKLPPTDATLFLHYNIYFGVDLTGGWNGLLWIPLTGATILVMNVVLLLAMKAVPRVLQHVVAIMTLLLQLVVLSALWLVVYINLA